MLISTVVGSHVLTRCLQVTTLCVVWQTVKTQKKCQ